MIDKFIALFEYRLAPDVTTNLLYVFIPLAVCGLCWLWTRLP
jgi:hypothetical protein